MPSTVLAPDPQAAQSPAPQRNLIGPAAVLAGAASLGVALLTDANLVAGALAVVGLVLAIATVIRGRGRRGAWVAALIAVMLGLGTIGTVFGSEPVAAAVAPPAGQVIAKSEVDSSPVRVSFGALTPNPETGSTSATVTVTNLTNVPVSTWVSISAMSPDGDKEYAAQGVGVRDLEPGASSTQEIHFDAELSPNTVLVVKDIL